MGNCLVLQENVVKIVKTDGKVIEYKAPIKVQQVLTEFAGHAISGSLPGFRHLQPNTWLLSGQLYYLVPLPPPSPKIGKKKVTFANPEVQGAQETETSVVRIKLVISKQQLQDMLQNGGEISLNKMLSLVHGDKGTADGEDMSPKADDASVGWKPALESIPEVN
ncbi:hypothetical protein L6164_033853 [Bauhinia variegata]|uniref:Uncharacterized protein n=1 Tax=Bauhinia variegata TaxID=167791 RepID=A0ACB9KT97_BAUVA|nr:hypothetical protein L6164_033853 [Bauhinia variegata]